jgi:hypothetical protein
MWPVLMDFNMLIYDRTDLICITDSTVIHVYYSPNFVTDLKGSEYFFLVSDSTKSSREHC